MMPRHVYIIVAMLCVPAVHADDFVDRADANGDGFVSLYELRGAHYADIEFNQRIEQSFADYDSNGDGLISEDERQAKRGAPAATAESATSEDPTTEIDAAPSAGGPTDELQAASAVAAAAAVPSPSDDVIQSMGAEPAARALADDLPAATATAVALTNGDAGPPGEKGDTANLSRTESLMLEIDVDNSGGASVDELVANSDGEQWFTQKAFDSADKNGDRALNPDELEVLLQSLERRRR